jgi:hypothetical protein
MKGDQTIRKKLSELVSDANADNWWRPELFEQHTLSQIPSTLEIVTPPPTEEQNYNCFVYVLGLQHDERFLGNKGWIFTRKLSKWSWGPLLRHKIFDVPNHYGSTVEFYAMSEKVKDFVVARI